MDIGWFSGTRARPVLPSDSDTIAAPFATRHGDLQAHDFTAPAPNRRWVADITYVPTWSGFVYVAFVNDLYSRRIIGWRAATSLRADRPGFPRAGDLATPPQGRQPGRLIHHSDRGVQYLSVRYTDRLADIGALASVCARGHSYESAAAEAQFGLYKTELSRRRGRWRWHDHVEVATLEWVNWFNHRRLHSARGNALPPSTNNSTTVRTPLHNPWSRQNRASTEPGAAVHLGGAIPLTAPRHTGRSSPIHDIKPCRHTNSTNVPGHHNWLTPASTTAGAARST